MHIPSEVRRIVQQYLANMVEDYARLRGPKGREWHESYRRLLQHVSDRMQKRLDGDWREWLKIQGEVQKTVNDCCEELRRW